MPSLAQGYGKGLLLGLQLEEAKRRKQRDELSDEFLKERLEDMRFQRKTLMSQLKQQEEERRQAGLEKEQKGWRMAATGQGLRDLLLGAGISMPQAELAETEYYETEKIPSYAAEWLTPPKPEKSRTPDAFQKMFGRILLSKKKEQAGVYGPSKPTEMLKGETWDEAMRREYEYGEEEILQPAVQKWITDWEKDVFGEVKEAKFKSYEYDKKDTEIERAQKAETAKRAYFDKWIKRVPADLRMEVREQAGMGAPVGVEEEEELRNKTNEVAEKLLARIKDGEFDRQYIQDYIDENIEEYKTQGVNPDLLKQIIGF